MSIQVYGWKDLRMAVTGAASGPAAPTNTVFGPTGVIKQLAFAVDDSVYLAGHVDHDIKVGATAFMHVHWTTDGTETNTVKWQLTYVVAPGHDQGNYPADTVITLEEAAQGTAWRHMITEDSVGFVMPEIDSLIILELKRITNGGSENTDAVYANFTDIHYQVGQFATPSRTPDFYTP